MNPINFKTAKLTYNQAKSLLQKEIATYQTISEHNDKSISEMVDLEYGFCVSAIIRDIIINMGITENIEGQPFTMVYNGLLDNVEFEELFL